MRWEGIGWIHVPEESQRAVGPFLPYSTAEIYCYVFSFVNIIVMNTCLNEKCILKWRKMEEM